MFETFKGNISLWRRANARNVRLYYPYRQYTNLFIFRFVSQYSAYAEHYVYLNKTFLKVEEAVTGASKIGYPVMVRAAYALGGLGSGLCEDEEILRQTTAKVAIIKTIF